MVDLFIQYFDEAKPYDAGLKSLLAIKQANVSLTSILYGDLDLTSIPTRIHFMGDSFLTYLWMPLNPRYT